MEDKTVIVEPFSGEIRLKSRAGHRQLDTLMKQEP